MTMCVLPWISYFAMSLFFSYGYDCYSLCMTVFFRHTQKQQANVMPTIINAPPSVQTNMISSLWSYFWGYAISAYSFQIVTSPFLMPEATYLPFFEISQTNTSFWSWALKIVFGMSVVRLRNTKFLSAEIKSCPLILAFMQLGEPQGLVEKEYETSYLLVQGLTEQNLIVLSLLATQNWLMQGLKITNFKSAKLSANVVTKVLVVRLWISVRIGGVICLLIETMYCESLETDVQKIYEPEAWLVVAPPAMAAQVAALQI